MTLILFLGGLFLATFLLGMLLEKIRIPWVFAALLLGLGLAFYNPFPSITGSSTFKFLGELGMYFLLFLVGFELRWNKIRKLEKFIVKSTFFIILVEALFGSLLIHFVFSYGWLLSILVALSFATVGEAVLLPILDEFKLTKTRLGQTILGVGTLDDVIEIFVIVAAMLAIPFLAGTGSQLGGNLEWEVIIYSLLSLGILSFIFIKLKDKIPQKKFPNREAVFLLILSVFFLFMGIGIIGEESLAGLGAILAGLSISRFLPEQRSKEMETELRGVVYSLFAPIFFLWVGVDINTDYLLMAPLLVLLVMGVVKFAKVFSSWWIGRKKLGDKKSIIMGISLAVKFSTSIVIIKLLFEKGIMGSHLYSVLIGAKIGFKFLVPFLLSWLIPKWKISSPKEVE